MRQRFECDEFGPWLNEATPTGDGELETLLALRGRYPELCSDPVAVECLTVEGRWRNKKKCSSVVIYYDTWFELR